MKIVSIQGSPRRSQNTAAIMGKILEGARSSGAEITQFTINEMKIHPCLACDQCKKTGFCVVNDDMRLIYDALDEARGLVLGTPIYFDHVSAQTKIFLDRLYAYFGPNNTNRFPQGYKAALAFAWGDSSPELYDSVIDWVKGRLTGYYQMEIVDALKAWDTDNFPAAQNAVLLQQAYEAGKKLV